LRFSRKNNDALINYYPSGRWAFRARAVFQRSNRLGLISEAVSAGHRREAVPHRGGGAAGQSPLFENEGDGERAQRLGLPAEGFAHVVDGRVLLEQGDDLIPEAVALGAGFRAFGRGEEELPAPVLAELMDPDAKTAWV
jgi:hypothetical protein